MENLHQNMNKIKRKENMKTSSGANKSHQFTHEYVYVCHNVISEDVSTNNNVLQSYNSSPKCGMKFLHFKYTRKGARKIMSLQVTQVNIIGAPM